MALSFDIEDAVAEMALAGGQVHFARDRLDAVIDALGEEAVFVRRFGPDEGPFATARLMAVRRDDRGLYAQLYALRPLDAPTESGAFSENSLHSQRLDYDAAPQSLFALPDRPDAGGMVRVLLEAYGRRCAFTGEMLLTNGTGEEASFIQPLAEGGTMTLSNMIVGVPSALNALRRGHLTIGPGHELIAALDQIDPELLVTLNAIGRITLPKLAEAVPAASALDWHRTVMFDRQNR